MVRKKSYISEDTQAVDTVDDSLTDVLNVSDDSDESQAFTVKVDRGSDEYLATHPRVGSVVFSILLGICGLAATAVTFYIGVWTLTGQYFDSWMWSQMSHIFPSVAHYVPPIFTDSTMIIAISVIMIAAALLTAALRKRFYTFSLIAIFIVVSFVTAYISKRVLPRPVLDSLIPDPANSAPSGHTALTMIAGVALVMAVPRILRAIATLWSSIFTSLVGIMVIYDGWHRPTDSLTAIALVGSLGVITMAFTRVSGMDPLGKRKSSPTIQIVATVLIVLGIASIAYGSYILYQIHSVVQYRPDALVSSGAYATIALILGSSSLTYGCLVAVRQLTASPLTRLGLVGAPPAPPTRK